jgi:hypothetical protein
MSSGVLHQVLGAYTKALVVNGAAGSRKTDTAVKFTLHETSEGKNVMILTKVGSVTDETKTRLSQQGSLKFKRRGNHFYTSSIEVANFDAMIDYQLRHVLKHDIPKERGDSHTWKLAEYERLLDENVLALGGRTIRSCHKSQPVDVLIIDEFQDFEPSVVRVIFKAVKRDSVMQLVTFGDVLQTIFHAHGVHPMTAIQHEFPRECTLIHSNVVWRCPLAHIEFVNAVHGNHLRAVKLPLLRSANSDTLNRPIIFAHESLGSPTVIGAYKLARTVAECIKTLMQEQSNITPADVAVLMSSANRNVVFTELQKELSNLYHKEFGYAREMAKVFETIFEDQRVSIDWGGAKGKTVMLSIHGDKGKGHRVVFLLGYTEGSIPNKTRLFKPDELIDQSLSYVGLTRSTEHLIIGCNAVCPSRYLCRAIEEVKEKNLAALCWAKETWTTPIHQRICPILGGELPNFDMSRDRYYLQNSITRPFRGIYTVTEIARDVIEHHSDLMDNWNPKVFTKRFGNYAAVSALAKKHPEVHGYMMQVILERELARLAGGVVWIELVKRYITQFKVNAYYTDDECELAFAHDLRLNQRSAADVILPKEIKAIYDSLKLPSRLRGLLNRLKHKPTFVLPSALKSTDFVNSLEVFIDGKNTIDDIPSHVFWNVAVGKMFIEGREWRPHLRSLINAFHDTLADIKANVVKFIQYLEGKQIPLKSIKSSTKRNLLVAEEDPARLEAMGIRDRALYTMGITGIDDFSTENMIFELKAPIARKDISKTWIIQPLVYAALGDPFARAKYFSHFAIVDITKGEITSFHFPYKEFPRKLILSRILAKMNMLPEYIACMLEKLEPKVLQSEKSSRDGSSEDANSQAESESEMA